MKYIVVIPDSAKAQQVKVSTWKHDTLQAAQKEAMKISSDLYCEVIVAEVVGVCRPRVDWEATKVPPKVTTTST